MSRQLKNNTGIPEFEIESLARALLPAIQKLYENGKKESESSECLSEQHTTDVTLMTTNTTKSSSNGGDMYY